MTEDPLNESPNTSLVEFMRMWSDVISNRSSLAPDPDTPLKIGAFQRDGCKVLFVEDGTGITEEVGIESTEQSAQHMVELHNRFLAFKAEYNIKEIWPVSMESSTLEATVGPMTLNYEVSYLSDPREKDKP